MKKYLIISLVLLLVAFFSSANSFASEAGELLIKNPTPQDLVGKWAGYYKSSSSKRSDSRDVAFTVTFDKKITLTTSSSQSHKTFEDVKIKGSEIVAENLDREISLKLFKKSDGGKILRGDYVNRGNTMGGSSGGTYELNFVK